VDVWDDTEAQVADYADAGRFWPNWLLRVPIEVARFECDRTRQRGYRLSFAMTDDGWRILGGADRRAAFIDMAVESFRDELVRTLDRNREGKA